MRTLFFILFLALPMAALAAEEGGVKLQHVNIDLSDRASLQKGARIFVNYCLSCHSAKYMRYNRMGHDLGISDELVKENLLFAANKVSDRMKAVMTKEDAKKWFHAVPPDLTLIGRIKDPDWLYTYLLSFYRDDNSPSGWNNIVFDRVAMPNVLYEWQGEQRAVFKSVPRTIVTETPGGKITKKVVQEQVFDHFELIKPGSMTPNEYREAMRDLVNFLVYMAEPVKLVRYKIGAYVLLFLTLFLVVAYLLYKDYWKDVH